jgi:hypothetical protein
MDEARGQRNVLLPFSLDVDHQAFVWHVREISDYADFEGLDVATYQGLESALSIMRKRPLVFLVHPKNADLELKNYNPRFRKELYRLSPEKFNLASDFVSRVTGSGPFQWFIRDQYADFLRGSVQEYVAAAYEAGDNQLIQWLESLGPKQTSELQARAREWLNAEPSEPWEEGCSVVPTDGYEYAYFFFASGYGTILASGLGVAVSGGENARAYFEKPPSPLVKAMAADIIAEQADLPIRFQRVLEQAT